MKKTLLATTAAVLVAGSAAAVDVELYGQVNKGVFGYDDGRNSDYIVVDNARESTRFGLKGAQALDNGLTASVLLEGEVVDNASDQLTQRNGLVNPVVGTTPANSANGTFTSRQARVGLSGNFGGLYIGKQSTASDGAYRQDLAGVSDVMGSSFNEIGGGLQFRNETTGAFGSSINAKSSRMDENRANSVRYDSPIFAGFQGRAAVAQGGDLDFGVFYDGGFGDFKVAAAASAYFNNDDTSFRSVNNASDINTTTANADAENYAASVSIAHNSGLAGTLAYQEDSLDNKINGAGVKDPKTWYAKVGYSWDAYEVAADYGKSKDYLKGGLAAGKDEVRTFGLGAQYNLTDGVSLAALYRNFDAKQGAPNFDDIDLYGVNMKVRF